MLRAPTNHRPPGSLTVAVADGRGCGTLVSGGFFPPFLCLTHVEPVFRFYSNTNLQSFVMFPHSGAEKVESMSELRCGRLSIRLADVMVTKHGE